LKKKVKSALVYPSVIVTVAIGVVAILMIFVIPVFETMFSSAGQTLPLPTLIVVLISKYFRKYIFIVIPAMVLAFYFLRKWHKTDNGKAVIDRLLLKAPVFGSLFKKIAVARFSRTLGTLVSSGVPILDGLNIVSRTAGNKTIETAILSARAHSRGDHRRTSGAKQHLPSHGHPDDRRGRIDGRPGFHAGQDRGVL
jgi:type IV pilus assembly protein PilC